MPAHEILEKELFLFEFNQKRERFEFPVKLKLNLFGVEIVYEKLAVKCYALAVGKFDEIVACPNRKFVAKEASKFERFHKFL